MVESSTFLQSTVLRRSYRCQAVGESSYSLHRLATVATSCMRVFALFTLTLETMVSQSSETLEGLIVEINEGSHRF